MTTEIPVIDFAAFSSEDAVEKQEVSRLIYRACSEIGFFYGRNLGVSPVLAELLFEQLRRFFALPNSVKQQLPWSGPYSNRGYLGCGQEQLDPAYPGDIKETFNVGRETGLKQPERSNRWPSGMEDFRTHVLAFYDACTLASDRIFEAFAIALDLPTDFIVNQHNQQNNILRLLHYPPVDGVKPDHALRAGAHTDYGSLTLLFQESGSSGLEVQNGQGEWIAAPALANTILVNTGDLMEHWTNGLFRSTNHRVVIPGDDWASHSRYAAAFFCHPNEDAEISCIPSCQSSEQPPRYSTVMAGEYIRDRIQASGL
ncbi:isopenicillin N synthase family oxygenase [Phormidium tenue FACHB-886]|nr:isopenicillin N synthase family oxygenase [Phormidium tenue FACHB-886]